MIGQRVIRQMQVWIVGAGGHGQDVRAILDAANRAGAGWEFAGFLDDKETGPDVVGGVAEIAKDGPELFLIGVNDSRARSDIAGWAHPGRFSPALVHPHAWVDRGWKLEPGVVVAAGAVLATDGVLCRHSHVNAGASIHRSMIMDFVTIGPGARVCGDCHIGRGAQIGAGGIVVPWRNLPNWSKVGAGRVVTL